MRTWLWSPASLSGLRIRHFLELWCRSQTRPGSHIAVTVVDSCSSNSTPSLRSSICWGAALKRQKKKKKISERKEIYLVGHPMWKFRTLLRGVCWKKKALWRIFELALKNGQQLTTTWWGEGHFRQARWPFIQTFIIYLFIYLFIYLKFISSVVIPFLNYSWFTMLCQFLLYSKVTQSYTYIHSFQTLIGLE